MSLRDNLIHDTVGALPLPDPLEIHPRQSVAEAVALMQNRSQGYVVVTEHSQPMGMFTERDVLRKVLAEGIGLDTPIGEVMTPHPVVVRKEEKLASLIHTMHTGGFRHVPIVDDRGHLQGVVSVKRIVEYLVEHCPSAVFNLPPEPDPMQSSREGA